MAGPFPQGAHEQDCGRQTRRPGEGGGLGAECDDQRRRAASRVDRAEEGLRQQGRGDGGHRRGHPPDREGVDPREARIVRGAQRIQHREAAGRPTELADGGVPGPRARQIRQVDLQQYRGAEARHQQGLAQGDGEGADVEWGTVLLSIANDACMLSSPLKLGDGQGEWKSGMMRGLGH